MGELWDVFYEDFSENQLHSKGTALYKDISLSVSAKETEMEHMILMKCSPLAALKVVILTKLLPHAIEVTLKGMGDNNINSLALGKFEWNFSYVIFKWILVIDGWCISCETVLIWMSRDFIDDQSTLVQVMAWCHQAPSHYLSQCWPSTLSSYGITKPQWVSNKV